MVKSFRMSGGREIGSAVGARGVMGAVGRLMRLVAAAKVEAGPFGIAFRPVAGGRRQRENRDRDGRSRAEGRRLKGASRFGTGICGTGLPAAAMTRASAGLRLKAPGAALAAAAA